MKNFKELRENYKEKTLKEEIDKSEFRVGYHILRPFIYHRSTVNKHSVKTNFVRRENALDYDVEFSVNDGYSRDKINPPSSSDGLAIADHVKRVVKSFVHHYNPKSLYFEPSDNDRELKRTKDALYQRTLSRLGAKSIEPHPKHIGVYIAHFKEHFQEYLDTLMEDASRKPLNGASRRFGVSMREDAPTNSTGPAIAGMSAQSEPGVKKPRQRSLQKKNAQDAQERDGFTKVWRRKALPVMEAVEVKRGKFAGNDTFVVPSHVYHEAVHHKAKGAHWTKYLKETEYGTAIREFANKNPHKPIILEDEKTGYLTYARYGNKNKR